MNCQKTIPIGIGKSKCKCKGKGKCKYKKPISTQIANEPAKYCNKSSQNNNGMLHDGDGLTDDKSLKLIFMKPDTFKFGPNGPYKPQRLHRPISKKVTSLILAVTLILLPFGIYTTILSSTDTERL